MQKYKHILGIAILTLVLISLGSTALGAGAYVSIGELRETLPQRWTGDYIIKKGRW